MTHTSKQAVFGLCQQLPPLFLNPGNANISSNLKVSWNSLPSSLKRGQKPFCCRGCTGCWLVRRQDGVLVARVAVVWHWWQWCGSAGSPWHARDTQGALGWNWLSPAALQTSPSLGLSSARPHKLSSPKVRLCYVAPEVLERLQLSKTNPFQQLCALQRHLTSCFLRFSLGITEMLNNGEGELHLCFCRDYTDLLQAGLCW